MAKATEQDLKNVRAQVDKMQAEMAEKSLLGRTKKRLKRLFGGEEKTVTRQTIENRPPIKTQPMKKLTVKEMPKTNRTKQVESGLKQAGLDDADIAKFKPKGKK